MLDVVFAEPRVRPRLWCSSRWPTPTGASARTKPVAPASCSPACCGTTCRPLDRPGARARRRSRPCSRRSTGVRCAHRRHLRARQMAADMREIWIMQPASSARAATVRRSSKPAFAPASTSCACAPTRRRGDAVLAEWWEDFSLGTRRGRARPGDRRSAQQAQRTAAARAGARGIVAWRRQLQCGDAAAGRRTQRMDSSAGWPRPRRGQAGAAGAAAGGETGRGRDRSAVRRDRGRRPGAFVALGANPRRRWRDAGRAVRCAGGLPGTRTLATSLVCTRSAPIDAGGPGLRQCRRRAARPALGPEELLDALQEVERPARRDTRNAPRTLDLDHAASATPGRDAALDRCCTWRLHRRAFVLVPAAEIAPVAGLPGLGRPGFLPAVANQQIVAIPAPRAPRCRADMGDSDDHPARWPPEPTRHLPPE